MNMVPYDSTIAKLTIAEKITRNSAIILFILAVFAVIAFSHIRSEAKNDELRAAATQLVRENEQLQLQVKEKQKRLDAALVPQATIGDAVNEQVWQPGKKAANNVWESVKSVFN